MRNAIPIGYCADAIRVFDLGPLRCCSSCHDDIALGYYSDMSRIDVGDDWYDVCCVVSRAYDEAQRQRVIAASSSEGGAK